MLGAFSPFPHSLAAERSRGDSHAEPGRKQPAAAVVHSSKSQSPMARAASGQWSDGDPQREQPPLTDGSVRTVNFLQSYGSSCGPVCDCGDCDASCGAEAFYQEDPGCGFEVGCGLGSAIETVRSYNWGKQGCDAGCTDGCCENSCGIEGGYLGDPVCGIEASGECPCDACSSGKMDHIPLCVPILRMNWCSIDFMYGHQGYTGPLNFVSTSSNNPNQRSGTGSFGFYQGFNKGASLKRWLGCDVTSQFGVRATQSNLWGAGFTTDRRYQVFVTGGFFRRVDYGLQYGLVLDYLNQDWYFQSNSLQLRGEASWRRESCDTFGFQFMAGVRSESSDTVVTDGTGNTIFSTIGMEPTDQFRLFYRCPMVRAGEFTGFAGWTDHSDAVLGTKITLPIFSSVLLATDLTYLIPNEGRFSGGNEQESWNVAIGFVFRPGGYKGRQRYNLPLFDVADNGTFMMDRL